MLLQEAANKPSHLWYILGRAKRRPKIYHKCILLIYISASINTYIYIYTYVNKYIYIYICMYVYVCVYIYIYICIYVYISIYTYTHVYAHRRREAARIALHLAGNSLATYFWLLFVFLFRFLIFSIFLLRLETRSLPIFGCFLCNNSY